MDHGRKRKLDARKRREESKGARYGVFEGPEFKKEARVPREKSTERSDGINKGALSGSRTNRTPSGR